MLQSRFSSVDLCESLPLNTREKHTWYLLAFLCESWFLCWPVRSSLILVHRAIYNSTTTLFPGVIFQLDKETLHESLHLSGDHLTVRQSTMVHGNVFGTTFLTDGCHFWTITIDNFKGENSFLAVGRLLTSDFLNWPLVKWNVSIVYEITKAANSIVKQFSLKAGTHRSFSSTGKHVPSGKRGKTCKTWWAREILIAWHARENIVHVQCGKYVTSCKRGKNRTV